MIEMLYKKKVIRDFLSLFTENYWKQLIASIAEYGIINFKKHHNIASLTPEEIIQVVEILKKDENLEDKKKTNLSNLNLNIKNTTKKTNVSRSRSKSKSNSKDHSEIKSKEILKNVNSYVKTNSVEKNYISKNKKPETKTRTSMTPNKNTTVAFKSVKNNNQNNKVIENSASSRSLKPIDRSLSKSKVKFSSKLTNNKEYSSNKIKNSFESNDKSDNISSISNIKTLKMKKNIENDNNYSNHAHGTPSTVSTTKKKPNEIIEQININKLKEKKKNQKKEEEVEEKKPIVKKFSNVESRIKGALESDKKIYNMLKNTRNDNNEVENTVYTNDKVAVGAKNNYVVNNNEPKSSILTLEERLNGLTQKIAKVEKNKAEEDNTNTKSNQLSSLTKNNKYSYTYDTSKNESNNNHNVINSINDEDYIPEDQIDLNKYNYLYNNYNKSNNDNYENEENDDNFIEKDEIDNDIYTYKHRNLQIGDDDDEQDNHNYDDLEEE